MIFSPRKRFVEEDVAFGYKVICWVKIQTIESQKEKTAAI